MAIDFSGRTVMVTGAAGNLGRAAAAAFAGYGANLVLVDLSREGLEKAYGEPTARRVLAPVNLLDSGEVDAAAKSAHARYRRLDVLCSIAGGFRMGEAVHETTDKTWDFLMDVNVRTLLNAVRAVVPLMIERGGGRIVNVGAFAAQKGVARMGAYCASKSAVIRLTESLAPSCARRTST